MKTKINKFIGAAAMTAVLALTLSSCKKDNDSNTSGLTATLSFVNTVEGSTAQDVYVNDSKVSASAVAYGNSSGNLTTSSGNKTISFKNSGSTTVTAAANINADVNTSQTAFLVKQADGSLAVSTYANDNTTASGKVKVRFINVAPLLASSVNIITSTGSSLISALTFKAASAYQTIDANTNLNLNTTGSLEITTINGAELQAGKNYTIWLDSSTSTKVKYHVIAQN